MTATHPTIGILRRVVAGPSMQDEAFARRLSIPGYFPESLRQATGLIELESGVFLFHQGATATACYRVVRGSIRLTRSAMKGTSAVIQRASAGDWLVEPGPCDDLHDSTAVAGDPSLVLAVAIRQFRVDLRHNPAFASAWGMEMSEAVKRLQRRVERLALPRARDRVIHYLVTEGDGNDAEAHLESSLHVWAGQLGIAAETLSRVLAKLSADGCIERQGRTLKLIGKP